MALETINGKTTSAVRIDHPTGQKLRIERLLFLYCRSILSVISVKRFALTSTGREVYIRVGQREFSRGDGDVAVSQTTLTTGLLAVAVVTVDI